MKNESKTDDSSFSITCVIFDWMRHNRKGKDVFPLTINSNPDGANIVIVDESGKKMLSGTTPTTVSLAAGQSYFHAKTYSITFSKAGYTEQYATVKATLSGWYFGNILSVV